MRHRMHEVQHAVAAGHVAEQHARGSDLDAPVPGHDGQVLVHAVVQRSDEGVLALVEPRRRLASRQDASGHDLLRELGSVPVIPEVGEALNSSREAQVVVPQEAD